VDLVYARRHFAVHSGRGTFQTEKKMIKMSCLLKETHALALGQLIERLEFDAIRRCARSDQESYDMLFCLQSLRKALERRGDRSTAAVGSSSPHTPTMG
jgi:hypothetical protein